MTHSRVLEITSALGMRPLGSPSKEGWICFPCPFAPFLHPRGTDHNPSFFIHINNSGLSGFNCYTCKSKGRISAMIRRLEQLHGKDFGGLDIRADLFETPDEFVGYEEISSFEAEPEALNSSAYLSMFPLAWEEESSRDYLISRGIGPETAHLLGLLYDPEERRIVFPVYDASMQLFGFTGRTILAPNQYPFERYSRVKDYYGLRKTHFLLGEQLIDPSKPLWLVEGLFALAHMIEIGARNLVNPIAPMGSALHEPQRDRIAYYNRATYLVFDPDAAGDDGIYGTRLNASGDQRRDDGAITRLTGHCPVYVPYYPEGIDDIDHITLEDARWMIETAECVA